MKYIYIFIRPALGIFGLATLYVVGCHDQVSTGSSCGGLRHVSVLLPLGTLWGQGGCCSWWILQRFLMIKATQNPTLRIFLDAKPA